MKTKQAIILETAAYYAEDPSRRSAIEKPEAYACQYLGQGGKRCAFSRCCTESGAQAIDNDSDGESIQELNNSYKDVGEDFNVDDYLAPEYHGHSVEFWQHIQNLHDRRDFWNENGLTKMGVAYLNEVLTEYV